MSSETSECNRNFHDYLRKERIFGRSGSYARSLCAKKEVSSSQEAVSEQTREIVKAECPGQL